MRIQKDPGFSILFKHYYDHAIAKRVFRAHSKMKEVFNEAALNII